MGKARFNITLTIGRDYYLSQADNERDLLLKVKNAAFDLYPLWFIYNVHEPKTGICIEIEPVYQENATPINQTIKIRRFDKGTKDETQLAGIDALIDQMKIWFEI